MPASSTPPPNKPHAQIYREYMALLKHGRMREAGPEHIRLYGRFLLVAVVVGGPIGVAAGYVFISLGLSILRGDANSHPFLEDLRDRGVEARAEVTNHRVARETNAHFNQGSGVSRPITHNYTRIRFRFQTPDGRLVTGKAELPGAHPKPDRMAILYLPDDPGVHALSETVTRDSSGFDWSLSSVLPALILILAGAGTIIGASGFLLRRVLEYRALRKGLSTA